MPQPKRKLKASESSNITLHNFFGNQSSSHRQQGGRSSAHLPKNKRLDKPISPPQRLPSQEIIVIDSSDDDEIDLLVVCAASTQKRQKVDHDAPALSHTDSRGKGSLNGKDKSFESTISRTESSEKESALHFGTPFLLLPKEHADTLPSTSSPLSFGETSHILSSTNSPSIVNNEPSSSTSCIVERKLEEVDIDLTLDTDNDWEMGDDELASLAKTEDIEVEEEQSANDSLATCSYCNRRFKDIPDDQFETHNTSCFALHTGRSSVEERRSNSALASPIISGPPLLQSCDGKTRAVDQNAFSVLMSSFKDNEAWKEASMVEDKSFQSTRASGGRRKAPFYKVLQGMPIAVDAFRYGSIPGVTAYFLTHAHSDHYTNLSSSWQRGPIYCSEGTANLVMHMLSVDRKWVHPLPMDVPCLIPNTGGVHVTLIEANHCPGSCLFFFEGRQTIDAGDSTFKSRFIGSPKEFRYLHCGDFRASPRHIMHPAVAGKAIDHVYLDTTYLDPKYTFPPQALVISACSELARRLVSNTLFTEKNISLRSWMTGSKHEKGKEKEPKNERILFAIGTYSIGKERIVKAIAHALKTKVYCDARKAAILRCEGDEELSALLTTDPLGAIVHLLPLGSITSDNLKAYMERFKGTFTKIIGFRPTGWTFTPTTGANQTPTIVSVLSPQNRSFTYQDLQLARNSTSSIMLFPVPYSEHSSFFELTCFAVSFDWVKMIATVNVGSENSRRKMDKWIVRWEAERKRRGKVNIVPYRDPDYW